MPSDTRLAEGQNLAVMQGVIEKTANIMHKGLSRRQRFIFECGLDTFNAGGTSKHMANVTWRAKTQNDSYRKLEGLMASQK